MRATPTMVALLVLAGCGRSGVDPRQPDYVSPPTTQQSPRIAKEGPSPGTCVHACQNIAAINFKKCMKPNPLVPPPKPAVCELDRDEYLANCLLGCP